MPDKKMIQHGEYLIDVKPQPLRESSEWTTHFVIYHDKRAAIEPLQNIHMGNRCESESNAFDIGVSEAKRIIDELI
jgi:hypothetical protein